MNEVDNNYNIFFEFNSLSNKTKKTTRNSAEMQIASSETIEELKLNKDLEEMICNQIENQTKEVVTKFDIVQILEL